MHLKPKKVSEARIVGFWEKHSAGTKKGGKLAALSIWDREAFSLSPTSLATVRTFSNAKDAIKYQKNSDRFRIEIMGKNPKHFILQRVQFFDRRDNSLLERVYTGPSIFDFFTFKNREYPSRVKGGRYYGFLKNRLKKKGIDLDDPDQFDKINSKLEKAFREFGGFFTQVKGYNAVGSFSENVLVLDYDPKTKKFLLALIDHEHPSSIPIQ